MRQYSNPLNGADPKPGAQSPIKRALLALDHMQAQLVAQEQMAHEPIAIIGMGCRFPGGVYSPDEFWTLLKEGTNAVSDIPEDRWAVDQFYAPDPDIPGKTCMRQGGFLEQIDQFNPRFFGISAQEANVMDPQQRLLLEVGWETLEHAGCPPEKLKETQTGVYLGIYMTDYSRLMHEIGDRDQINAFSASGNSLSVAAGRLSYFLGLQGPSLAIDTACSSSLVSVHLACQSLRSRDCSVALAGGVNLILTPDSAIALSKGHLLNPDGQCRTFDASANGFTKGEGCGLVLLKRLSDAEKEGDRILATIRGSAVNHNGRSSSLVAPSGPAQQTVIRQALEFAQVHPNDVGYVEVQGTGSAIGDAIEVESLLGVYGGDRPLDHPLRVGTLKTNIGHLEASAGIAGLIKVVLSLQNEAIPAHLHLETPNPHIDWEHTPIEVPQKLTPWSKSENQPLIAGVSAFGFSGTNAHLLVSQAPSLVSSSNNKEKRKRPLHLLALSAQSQSELDHKVCELRDYLLSHKTIQIEDLCFTANAGRQHFSHRLGLVASSMPELIQKLSNLPSRIIKSSQGQNLTFVYGEALHYDSQSVKALLDTQPTLRQHFDECAQYFEEETGRSLLPLESNPNPETAAVFGFAWNYAITHLLKTWGIQPAIVSGHGLGRVIAVHIAEALSLSDAIKLIIRRTEILQSAKKTQSAQLMASTAAVSNDETSNRYSQNGYSQNGYSQNGHSKNGHSKNGDRPSTKLLSLRAETEENLALSNLQLREPTRPILELSDSSGPFFLAEYVKDGLFNRDTKAISPQLTLDEQNDSVTLPLDSVNSWSALLKTVAHAYESGVAIHWSAFEQDHEHNLISLPTYPWSRARYWFSSTSPIQNPPVLRGRGTNAEPQVTQSQSIPFPALTTPELQTWLTDRLSDAIGLDASAIDINARFDSYGLDSMLAINIASLAKQELGLEVSPMLLLHYPTIRQLSEHLATQAPLVPTLPAPQPFPICPDAPSCGGLQTSTLGHLIQGTGRSQGIDPVLTPLEMASKLKVTFKPLPAGNIAEPILEFRYRLEHLLQSYGVEIVPWKEACRPATYDLPIPVFGLTKKVNIQSVRSQIDAVVAIESPTTPRDRLNISIAESIYKLYRKFIWQDKAVSASQISQLIGWAEPNTQPLEDPTKTQVIVLNPLDATLTDSEIPYAQKIPQGVQTLIRNFAEIVIGIGDETLSILNMNLSDSVFPKTQLERFVLRSLIPKIYVPILPLPLSQFEQSSFDPQASPYAQELVNFGHALKPTGLLPSGFKIQHVVKRQSYRDIVNWLVKGRTGVSYGFVAQIEPPTYGNGPKTLPIETWDKLKPLPGMSPEDVRLSDQGRRYLKHIQQDKVCIQQIPDVWVVCSRSGANKTHLNLETDVVRVGLSDRLHLQFPASSSEADRRQIKPSYDLYVMIAIALGAALYLPKLVEQGASIVHFHGYPARQWFKFPQEGFSGLENPSVPCGTYESGVFNYLGIYRLAQSIGTTPAIACLIEPDHGSNLVASDWRTLVKRLQTGVDQGLIELGGRHFPSLQERQA